MFLTNCFYDHCLKALSICHKNSDNCFLYAKGIDVCQLVPLSYLLPHHG